MTTEKNACGNTQTSSARSDAFVILNDLPGRKKLRRHATHSTNVAPVGNQGNVARPERHQRGARPVPRTIQTFRDLGPLRPSLLIAGSRTVATCRGLLLRTVQIQVDQVNDDKYPKRHAR